MAQRRYGDDWNDRPDRDFRRPAGEDYREPRDSGFRQRGYDDDARQRGDRDDWRGGGDDRYGADRRSTFERDEFSGERGRDEGHAYGFVRGDQQGRERTRDQQQGWTPGQQGRMGGQERPGGYGYGGGMGAQGAQGGYGFDSPSQQGGGMGRGMGGAMGGMGGTMGGMSGQGQTGAHRGKGPKGYSRSDERIREDCCDRLSDNDQLDASNVSVSVSKGEVTLEGHVSSRQDKRLAEDCVEQCSGVSHVQNNLRVRSSSDDENGNSSSTGQQMQAGGNKPRLKES